MPRVSCKGSILKLSAGLCTPHTAPPRLLVMVTRAQPVSGFLQLRYTQSKTTGFVSRSHNEAKARAQAPQNALHQRTETTPRPAPLLLAIPLALSHTHPLRPVKRDAWSMVCCQQPETHNCILSATHQQRRQLTCRPESASVHKRTHTPRGTQGGKYTCHPHDRLPSTTGRRTSTPVWLLFDRQGSQGALLRPVRC